MDRSKIRKWAAVAGLLASAAMANGAYATQCTDSLQFDPPPVGGPLVTATRTWTVTGNPTDPTSCTTVDGNAQESQIDAFGGTTAYALNSSVVGASGSGGSLTDNWLTVVLDPGYTWGAAPAQGKWTLGSGFWNSYANAILSIHVGGGQPGDIDDSGLFKMASGTYTGTFSFTQSNVTGGGLSNLKLWTTPCTSRTDCNPPTTVAEPATLGLLSLGLVGLGIVRRRRQNVA